MLKKLLIEKVFEKPKVLNQCFSELLLALIINHFGTVEIDT